MTKKGARKRRKKEDHPDAGLLMVLMRYARGWWEQVKLVVAGGFHQSQVTKWERGERPVPGYALRRTADVTGFPRFLLGAALRVLRSFRLAARGWTRPGRVLAEASLVELFPLAISALDLILEPLATSEASVESPPVAADREAVESLFERLKRRTEKQRWLLVNHVAEFRQWALVERVAAESLRLASNQPGESLEWAKLAVRIAELVGGVKEWHWRLQGYALAVLTNSYRVCNDLPAARKTRARARQLWDDGQPGDPGLLNQALLPWIEAALYRDERDLPQALKQINEALALDNGELKGKILLTKANIHDAMNEPEASTAAILEAIPHIDAEREPRLAFGVLYNLISDLVQLGRAEEARQRLPETRRLAEQAGGELDLERVLGLEAKVAATLGDLGKARNGFEQVRSAFAKAELSYDYALVTMELSLVLLRQGETARVRTLAEEMLRIFRSQQVQPEALKALKVFCDAARKETATVELARRVARYLYRAKDDPELQFEAGTE